MTLDTEEARTARYNEFLKWYRTPKHLRESAKKFCEANGVNNMVLTKWKRGLDRKRPTRSPSNQDEKGQLEGEIVKEQVKAGTYDAIEHLKKNLPAVTRAVIEAAVTKLNPNAIKLIYELTGNYKARGESPGELDGVTLARLMVQAFNELEESKKSELQSQMKQNSLNGSSAGKTPDTSPEPTS